jgi:fatty acid desaturase
MRRLHAGAPCHLFPWGVSIAAMSAHAARDPRLHAVQWRDLTRLSRGEVTRELLVSLPWLAASLLLAGRALYLPALACSFFFFLTGLRQAHGAFHYTVGISRRATEWALVALSGAMLGSLHAVKHNHLRHHAHCLDEDDVEGRCARLSWWRALLYGPAFPVLLHAAALRGGSAATRRWIALELSLTAGLVAAAVALPGVPALRYHVLAMAVGQCMTSFFAVWTVHHDCDGERHLARTLRNRLKSWMSYAMFFHVEHHLFPAVPTCKLSRLAERLDAVAPELAEKRVF